MPTFKTVVSDCFNDIPLDGSNIKDDDDDNNGYENIEGETTVSFVEKVSEVSEVLKSATDVVAMARTEKAKAEPAVIVPANSETLAARQVVAEAPKDAETLILDAIKAPLDVLPKGAETVKEIETTQPSEPVIAVPQPSTKVRKAEKKVTTTSVKVDTDLVDDSNITNVDLLDPATVKEDPFQVAEDKSEGEHVETGSWHLTPPHIRFKGLYRQKSDALAVLMDGGVIPFGRYRDELVSASVDPAVYSWNTAEMFDKMQEVQKWRNRVLNIKLHVDQQAFMWERHIDIFRGYVATLYGLRGAAVDAAFYQHFYDFEVYYDRLKALVKMSEGVMKNLEGAFETLSRQVSIVLENNKASKDGARFERPEYQREVAKPDDIELQRNLAKFDSLDGTSASEPALKPTKVVKSPIEDGVALLTGNKFLPKTGKSNGSDWEVVK